jgi:hypothetical protein
MKNIALILLLALPLLSSAQDSNISINYGLMTTNYFCNNAKIGKNKFKSIISKDDKALAIFRQGRALMITGDVILGPSFFLLLITIQNQSRGNTPFPWMWYGGVGGTVAGTVLYYVGTNRTMQAVKVFNSNGKLSLHYNGSNGIGLTYRYTIK